MEGFPTIIALKFGMYLYTRRQQIEISKKANMVDQNNKHLIARQVVLFLKKWKLVKPKQGREREEDGSSSHIQKHIVTFHLDYTSLLEKSSLYSSMTSQWWPLCKVRVS